MARIRSVAWSHLPSFGGYDWLRLDPQEQPLWIYFLQGDEGGPVKIGRTRDLKYRLSRLCGGYPFGDLDYVGAIRGPWTLERDMHRRFAPLHLRYEWFRPDAELRDFILSLPEPA